jgi:predicted glutamine amidotransferase
MCGLIGFAAMDSVKGTLLQRRTWTETALYVGTLRGEDSTGIALINKLDNETSLYKAPVPGWAFTTTKQFTKAAAELQNSCVAIMHNRAATVGHVTYDNAHPFVNGPVTMAHNGTLQSWGAKGGGYGTDSEWLCSVLAAAPSPKQALESIKGAYALSWFDRRDGSLNLARNSQRPLVYVVSQDGAFMAWASEAWMIAAAGERSGWYDPVLLGSVIDVEVGLHYKFYPNRSLKPTLSRFESYQPATYGYYGHGTYYPDRNGGSSYNSSNSSKTDNVVKLPPHHERAVPEEFLAGKTVKFIGEDAQVSSGMFVLLEGPVITNHPMYIQASSSTLSKQQWNRYKNITDPVFMGTIASCVPYKEQGQDAYRVYVKDAQYVSTYSKYLKSPGAIDIYATEDLNDFAEPYTPNYIPGPGGILLDEAQFAALTQDGCCNCTSPIDLIDTLKYKGDSIMQLRWTKEQLPLCSNCYNSPLGRELAL